MIGKYRRSLNEKCPVCGSILEIRFLTEKLLINGEEAEIETVYIACSNSNCYYERDFEEKRKKYGR